MTWKRLPPWALLLFGVVPIAIVLTLSDALPKPVMLPLAMACLLWAGAMATLHWKRLDEAAKAAHRWAWYWGSSLGLALALLFAAIAFTAPSALSFAQGWVDANVEQGRPPAAIWLFLGVMATGVAQGLGFIGAYIYWWLAKR